MKLAEEIRSKENRLWQAFGDRRYGALIITRRDQYAWITAGADAVSSRVSPTSPVFLVLTPERHYAIGYTMDLPYAMDAGLSALNYEPVLLPTFGAGPTETALSLVSGRVAADTDLPGATNEYNLLVSLHEPLTSTEMTRYRQMATEGAKIMRDLAFWVQPGMSEQEVLAHITEFGHGEERTNHFHGGPVGYWISYPERMQSQATVAANSAYTFYFTISGVKNEELILVDEQDASIVSVDPEWLTLSVAYGGQVVNIPDILVR